MPASKQPNRLTTRFDSEPLQEQTMDTILENRAEILGSETFLNYGHEDRQVSFVELNEIANAIGNGLRELGIELEDKVSVMMRNPLHTLFVMFGIHKAGGVYSPINFEYKGSVLEYQINDTNPEVLFIEDQYVERLNAIADDIDSLPQIILREAGAESIPLDDRFSVTTLEGLKNDESTAPSVTADWHNEASIVYTSGTTGRPKGVVLPHRWIFGNYTLFYGQVLSEEDVVHTSLPMYHVGGVYVNVTAALIAGASVSLWDRFSPHDFWDRIEKYGATNTGLLSVMMPWLNGQPESDDDHRNPLKIVHMQPVPENYQELADRFGFEFITVGFGQTESGNPLAGIIHASRDRTPKELWKGHSSEEIRAIAEDLGAPVVDSLPEERFMGRPTSFMEATILDENDERLPPNETGELAFRPQQAGLILKEYYNKPKKTNQAFTNLWFHTGDAAYYDEEGNYYFVDRIGDVIRRRGENISSIQIQDAINEYSAVNQAAAFPIPAPEGGEDQIGAAVEPVDGEDVTRDGLNDYLDDALPSFMHPDQLLILDELPTTETNKIEKYKLRNRSTE